MRLTDDRWEAAPSSGLLPAAPPSKGFSLPVAVLLGVCFVLVWLYRSNTGFDHAVFIGEDFPVFWWQAHLEQDSISAPYAGYFHLVPRTAGAVAAAFPEIDAPLLFLIVYLAALLLTVIGLLCASDRVGPAMLAAILVAPNTGEVFASITYFQWVSAPILVGLYLGGLPADRPRRAFYGIAMIVAGLSGPFSALLAPLAALEAFWRWNANGWHASRDRMIVCAAVLAFGAASLLAYLLAGSEQIAMGDRTYHAVLATDAFRQVFSVLAQGHLAPVAWPAVGLACLVGVSVFLRPYRWEKLVLASFSMLVALVAINKFRFDPSAFASPEFGTRYFFVGSVSALAIVVLTALGDWRARVAVVVTLAVVAASYNVSAWRGPERKPTDWEAQFQAIRERPWAAVFVNPFWNFLVVRDPGGRKLYWVPRTSQPERSGELTVVPITPGVPLQLERQVTLESACGFSIPFVLYSGGSADPDDLVRIRVLTRSSSTGEERSQVYEIPVARLHDWSTVSVGAGHVGAQDVLVEIEAVSHRVLPVGLPAVDSDAPWKGTVTGSQQQFSGFMGTMECTVHSPFGVLPGEAEP